MYGVCQGFVVITFDTVNTFDTVDTIETVDIIETVDTLRVLVNSLEQCMGYARALLSILLILLRLLILSNFLSIALTDVWGMPRLCCQYCQYF